MLLSAALRVADRLATALMTLVEAVALSAKVGKTPTLPEAAAQTLFCRLSRLVTHLIRISTFGVRTPTKPKPTTRAPDNPAPAARPSRPTPPMPAARLPRHPGWLLAALPEIAPAVAADISALLADPAIATLLNLAPSLQRALRPLLRSLGLDAAPPFPTPPPPPSPSTKASRRPTPVLRPAPDQAAAPRHPVKTRPTEHPPCHVLFITIS